jgi:hypothetical protein
MTSTSHRRIARLRPPAGDHPHYLDEEIRTSSVNPACPTRSMRSSASSSRKIRAIAFPPGRAAAGCRAAGASAAADPISGRRGRGELYAAPLIDARTKPSSSARDADARDARNGVISRRGGHGKSASSARRRAPARWRARVLRTLSVNRKTIYAPFFGIFQQMAGVNPEADVAKRSAILRPVGGSVGPDTPSPQTDRSSASSIARAVAAGHLRIPRRQRDRGLAADPIIEDLQADPSTAELFAFLVGGTEQAPRHRNSH